MLKWTKTLIVVLVLCFCVPVIKKGLPIVQPNESFRALISKDQFQAKLNLKIPEWMKEQLESDFKDFKMIRSDAVEKTCQQIESKTAKNTTSYRYRILDNKLYKYASSKRSFSSKDSPLEKAIKTLLLLCRVPDVDFILCPMDGLPEPYMPKDFYLTDDPKDQAPILANAKLTTTHCGILIPDKFSLTDDWVQTSVEILGLNQEISWDLKKGVAFWRGGLTDIGIPNGTFASNYQTCPRFIISKLSVDFPKIVDAGIPWADCKETKTALQEAQVMKGGATKKEHLLCKYLPVLDGHMCTYPGYQWRLLSNSVCLKQESDQIQWFYSALKPFVHYIPIKNDMSDLVDRVLWAESHETEVKEIAKNAREFALNNLMPEDDYFYLYLVFQKYASLQNMDFNKIKKETRSDERWKCIQYRKRLALSKSWHRFQNRFMSYR